MKKPNIMVIMTDEQRYDAVGYMNSEVYSPALCALKNDSLCFVNGYTTNPSCVPARAAMFSGKYPSQCGAPAYITPLEANETTFMSRLREAGYYTAVVGKQHFAGSKAAHGYDYEDIVDTHFPKFSETNSYISWLRSKGFSDESKFSERDGRFAWKWTADMSYHVDHYVGEKGNKWLREESMKQEKPWFFTLSFPGPHMPYNGLGLPTEALYDEGKISIPKTCQDDLKQKPDYYMEQIRSGKGNPGKMPVIDATEDEIRHTRKAYYSTVSFIDSQIAEAIRILKETNQYDDTLIFFTADHGDYMGDFGMFGKGQYLSEVLMRVPLLVKPPVAGFAGREVSDYALNFDMAATCLDAAGTEVPIEMSARSLCGYWDSEKKTEAPEYLYTEALNVRAIQNKDWKLIYYQDRPYGELYFLKEDPDEIYNLYDLTKYQQIQQLLMKKLCDKMIELGRNSQSKWNYAAPVI